MSDFKLPSKVMLVPMSGVTTYPFRMMSRKLGCKFAFLEMIDTRSICFKSRRTEEMIGRLEDGPLGIQLLGSEIEYVVKSLDYIDCEKFELIDFNAACPQKKVVGKNKGASFLQSPKRLNDVLAALVKASTLPVTVKIRSGWDDPVYILDIASACCDAGVKAIFIHGRTRAQCYRGSVDYKAIAKVKDNVSICVVGSGDIFDPITAKKMISETAVDGVLVARGAMGNPWVFKQIETYLQDGVLIDKPKASEIAEIMKDHLALSVDYYGEKRGVIKFRHCYIWYTAGFSRAKHLRNIASITKTQEKMLDLIDEFTSIVKGG